MTKTRLRVRGTVEEQIAPRSRWLPIYAFVWWATVPVLGLLVWRAARHPESAFAILVGGVFAAGLGLLIVPQVVYFLSRRSLHASSTAFFIICAWFSISQLPPFDQMREDHRRSALRSKDSSVLLQYVQQVQYAVGEAGVRAADGVEQNRGLADRLRALGQRLDGDARRAATALGVVFDRLNAAETAWLEEASTLAELAPFHHESLRLREDFEVRVESVDRVLAARREMGRAFQRLPERIQRALLTNHVPLAEIDDIVRALISVETLEQEARMRELELRYFRATRGLLVLLHEYRGEWTWNPETAWIDTDSAVLYCELEVLREELVEAGDSREAAKRRFHRQIQRRVGRPPR